MNPRWPKDLSPYWAQIDSIEFQLAIEIQLLAKAIQLWPMKPTVSARPSACDALHAQIAGQRPTKEVLSFELRHKAPVDLCPMVHQVLKSLQWIRTAWNSLPWAQDCPDIDGLSGPSRDIPHLELSGEIHTCLE